MSALLATAAQPHRITVMQGQARVGAAPDILLTTVLGSCVACCLFDPQAGVGGMNHFLLAEPKGSKAGCVDENFGVYLMEILINEMLQAGALKRRMKAHLYGGANLHAGMQPIGTANAAFARDFLQREDIPLSHADLGGHHARRVDFMPALGRARCRTVEDRRAGPETPTNRPARATGDVELF